VENSTLISDIDIVAATGSVNAKLTKTATVSVTDGKLSIQLISLVENAVISAIEISAVAPGSPIGTPVGPPVAPPVTAPLTAPIYISAGDKIAYNGTTNFWVADTAFASGGSFSFPIADSQPINNTIEDGLYRKVRIF
jgi:hypothetical protein